MSAPNLSQPTRIVTVASKAAATAARRMMRGDRTCVHRGSECLPAVVLAIENMVASDSVLYVTVGKR